MYFIEERKSLIPQFIPVQHHMNKLLKVVKWTAIIAGVIAIPILIKKKMEENEKNDENVRYDTNDYISESGL